MVHTKAVPEMTAFDCYREVMDMTSEGLLREAETLRERVLQERRELHRHAETGFG